MGNANGREDGSNGEEEDQIGGGGGGRSNLESAPTSNPPGRVGSSDSMGNTPPESPGRTRSPLMFTPQYKFFVDMNSLQFVSKKLQAKYTSTGFKRVPFLLESAQILDFLKRISSVGQVPVIPLQRGDGPPLNQIWYNESHASSDHPPERGIPTMITWNYDGNDVAVEGSWDNWTSSKKLQRSGKDHSILLVLPSGIYHYRLRVDGEERYIPDLPFVADETNCIYNLLDVHDYVPENPQSVAEFEAPQSPDSTYSQAFPAEEDFAKEPLLVPPQLHLTVLGMEKSDEASSSSSSPSPSKPQHVVLNHLYIEKGWASQSVVALGLTHRFQSKYVTVVLYKPLNR